MIFQEENKYYNSSDKFIKLNPQQGKITSYFLNPYNEQLIRCFSQRKNEQKSDQSQSTRTASLTNINDCNLLEDLIEQQDDFYTKTLVRGDNYTHAQKKTFISNCHEDVIYAQTQLKSFDYSLIQQRGVNIAIKGDKKKKKKLLLLDLDGTLAYRCRDQDKEKPDYIIYKNKNQHIIDQIGIKKRPYVLQFFNQMVQYYNIVVFSQQKEEYIQSVLRYLDPSQKYIKGYLTQQNCLKTNKGYYIKDLRIIQNYQLKDMVIIDSQVHSFAYQLDNGVPIIKYNGSRHDKELLFLQKYLIDAAQEYDIREFNREQLKLYQLGKVRLSDIKFDNDDDD